MLVWYEQSKKALSFLLLFLISFSFVSSQPFQTSESQYTLTISVPSQRFFIKADYYEFAVRPFTPAGLMLNGSQVNCSATFYDGEGLVVDSQNLTYNSSLRAFSDSMYVDGRGEINYVAICSNSTIGGFSSGQFIVTADGRNLDFDATLKLILIFFVGVVLFVLGKKYEDYTIGILSGFVWFLLGVYILLNPVIGWSDWFNTVVGSVLFAVGSYVWIRGSIENIDLRGFFG